MQIKIFQQIFIFSKKKFGHSKTRKKTIKGFYKINQRLKTNNIARYYKYRLPYRKTCFDFIKLNTNLRLKFLIQNFIQKYFSIQVETKLIHSLNAHKNQNYFRLAFPI